MSIVPFKKEHFRAIEPQPAQRYVPATVDESALDALERNGASFTCVVGGAPVMCFGWSAIYPTRAVIWGYLSKDAGRHMVRLTRIGRGLVRDLNFKRLEIEVDCEFREGHRWARLLGFKPEVPRLEAYNAHGGDTTLYARIK